MKGGYLTSIGEGNRSHHPTITIQDNVHTSAYKNMSRDYGNIQLVNTAGTVVVTSTHRFWKNIPSIGDKVQLSGFTNPENNDVFTITAVNENNIAFSSTSAVTETITSYEGAVVLLVETKKVYQDITMTDGVPQYFIVNGGDNDTHASKAGAYSYITVVNSTDATVYIHVAGGAFCIPSGGSLGHEVRQFTGNIKIDASLGTTGICVVNIS